MKIIVLKDVAPIYSGRCLSELQANAVFPFLGQKSGVKMRESCSSEKVNKLPLVSRRHNPEDSNLHSYLLWEPQSPHLECLNLNQYAYVPSLHIQIKNSA
jgi:hypothetical protein